MASENSNRHKSSGNSLTTRRSTLKTLSSLGAISTFGISSGKSPDKKPICGGCGGGGGNGIIPSADTYTASDGPIKYETDLASGIKNIYSYSDQRGNLLREYRVSSESVSRIKEPSGWKEEPGIRQTRIDVYDKSVTDILYEGTGDNLGARPPVSGNSSISYPSVVEDLFGIALAYISSYLGHALTAAQVVAKLINGSTAPDQQKDRVSWVWNYPDGGGVTQIPDSSHHSKFTIRSSIGEPVTNTVTSSMEWHSISDEWLNTGWDIHYDGHKPKSASNSSTIPTSEISSFQEAVERSPHPPENPNEWIYIPVPDDFEPTRIPISKLPKHSPIRQAVDGEYVTRTKTPIWIRSITDD